MRLLIVMFMLQASACFADSAPAQPCQYRETGVDEGATQLAVELQSILPEAGGRIDRATVLEADVEFQIPGFMPNKFFLMPRFPTTYGTTTPGSRADTPFLLNARGRAHICVPLAEIFDDASVRWPLTLNISINEVQSDNSSRPLADSKTIAFSPFDGPAGANARRSEQPPEDYVRALMRAFTFFESHRALNSVCGIRLPELQEDFARVYPTWNTRHTDIITLINTLQLEQFRLSGKYQPEVASRIFESVRASIAKEYEKLPETALRETCRAAAGEMADENYDIDAAIGNELRIVRRWQASRAVSRP